MFRKAAGFFNAPKTYATWNPADKSANVTLSNGNLTAYATTSAGSVRSTIGKSSGKWFFELTPVGGQNPQGIGNSSALLSTYPGANINGYGYLASLLYHNGSTSYGVNTAPGGVRGIALDMDAKTLTFYYNGVSQGIAATGLTGTWFAMGYCPGTSTVHLNANFGATPFAYPAPAGYNPGLYL